VFVRRVGRTRWLDFRRLQAVLFVPAAARAHFDSKPRRTSFSVRRWLTHSLTHPMQTRPTCVKPHARCLKRLSIMRTSACAPWVERFRAS